ncbi:MAG: DUF3387 domain-containing protein [Proteobacteria bacterium]|nr:DUF3387 domain-containing protein [Pseudomonadota bacterium]
MHRIVAIACRRASSGNAVAPSRQGQIIEELIALWKQFPEEASGALTSGLSTTRWPPMSRLRELGDATLKRTAVELTLKLRNSVTVDWSVRDSVRPSLRVMVKTLLRRYKYPPDKEEEATETVPKQAEMLSAEWAVA